MKLRVQVIIESDGGETTVQEVAHVERGAQRMEQLGLSLHEGNALLREIQRAMVREQVHHYVVTHSHCADCGTQRGHKGAHAIVYRTVFGKLRVSSPRLYACRCRERAKKSTSPLAELITERTTPELLYLENRFAAVMSFEAAETLLQEVLPLNGTISVAGIHRTVQKVAERLERELGPERTAFIEGCQRDWDELPAPGPPLTVGLDGGYVHAKQQRSRHEGWFEVIVGKSVTDDGDGKCFAYVQTHDNKPKRRLFEFMKSQGLQENQVVRFLTDGGDDVRTVPELLSAESEHMLDWFHITMRLTVMGQMAKSLPGHSADKPEQTEDEEMEDIEPTVAAEETVGTRAHVRGRLGRVKWLLWHGNVGRALEEIEDIVLVVEAVSNGADGEPKLLRAAKEFETYIEGNAGLIPNYGDRYRHGERITTAFVESAVNQVISKRLVKKQHMRWSEQGAHNLLQVRTRVLNGEWRGIVDRWYPTIRGAGTDGLLPRKAA